MKDSEEVIEQTLEIVKSIPNGISYTEYLEENLYKIIRRRRSIENILSLIPFDNQYVPIKT